MGIPACACWGAQAASLRVSAACRDRGKFAVSEKLHVQRCCRQGCRQLHASSLCSPEIRETRALPNHYNAGSKIFFANSQSIPRLKSASAVPSIGSL